jgi:formiminoglutamase
MQHLHIYSKKEVVELLNIRRFETKFGERIQTITDTNNWEQELTDSKAPFVLVGIPEDIGIEANYGTKGASDTWPLFLQQLLNTQSNDFLIGDEILLLGAFDFSALEEPIIKFTHSTEEQIDAMRHAVNTIDDTVENVVKKIASSGKIPIIIGGGQNNAYPLIKACAKGLHKKGVLPDPVLNIINVDAHMDYRPLEGRHNGNAFRYAEDDGYLHKYFVLGFHENYISQGVWTDFVNNPNFDAISYEDIFLREKCSFLDATVTSFVFTEDTPVGIEIDADALQGVVSSATTPSGISVDNIRQFVHLAASKTQVAYLHLSEGVAHKDNTVARLYCYLVTDFIKAFLHKDI